MPVKRKNPKTKSRRVPKSMLLKKKMIAIPAMGPGGAVLLPASLLNKAVGAASGLVAKNARRKGVRKAARQVGGVSRAIARYL